MPVLSSTTTPLISTASAGKLIAKISATLKKKAEAWTIASENPLSYNDPDKEPSLRILKIDPVDVTAPITIKPLCITLFRVSAVE